MRAFRFFKKDGEFYKRVFTITWPIALQSLISIGVNMLDTIMVGSLGDDALSATSLANSFITIYHIFCMGLGMGASVLVSRYWGMKNAAELIDDKAGIRDSERALKQTIALMLRITLGLAFCFALSTAIMPGTIMKMYNGEEAILSLGETYFRYSVVTYFFLGASLVCTIVLRSVGQVKLPLFVSIGAFSINLAANYVLIFGKLGFPKMGVAGAAIATLAARVFEAAAICGYLLIFDKKIRFRIKHLFMNTKSLIGEYFRISIPVLISDGILALGNNAVAMVIGHLGGTFVSANAITSVTQQLSSVVISGVSQAGAIVTGQTLGEGDKEKAMDQGFLFMGLGIFLGIIAAGVILVLSGPIIASYKNVSEETVKIAGQLMLAISIIVVFQGTNSIMTKGVLRGGGDTKMLMLTDNIFLWVLAIPLGLLGGFVLKVSPFWIYIFLKSDQIVKAVWAFLRLRSGKWIKKISVGKTDSLGETNEQLQTENLQTEQLKTVQE
ncbi:MAG: MATE family efflux transporter [Lachnospiraceae bacterium]|nr:MATE family efflux transporter [Lachnospiraceae bacterium]